MKQIWQDTLAHSKWQMGIQNQVCLFLAHHAPLIQKEMLNQVYSQV